MRASLRGRRSGAQDAHPVPRSGASRWLGLAPALLALLGAAYMLRAQQALTGNLWGVPLDDAYIHFQYARNLAGGHGFAFNAGQPIPGSTSPLWVILLAALSLVGLPLWLAAKVLGIAALALAATLTWRLAAQYVTAPFGALAAGALTALDGRLLWAAPSGMEVTLFAALCLAAFLARPVGAGPATTRQALVIAALCGLATLTRPEGYLLAAVLAADLFLRARPPWRAIGLAAVVYVALVAPYVVFSLLTTGHPLPTTFYAKASTAGTATPGSITNYLLAFAAIVFITNASLAVLAPVGAIVLWRRGGSAWAVVAWPVLLVLEQAMLSPALYHFGRYVMPLEPFFALWAVVGIGRLTRNMAERARGGDALRQAMPPLALVLVGLLSLHLWTGWYAYSVQNIDNMHVALGNWVKAHIPAGVPVAMNDVGAITYISQHPAVDIEGLVTPSFLALKHEQPEQRRERDIYTMVRRSGVRYLIIFPAVYPYLARQAGLQRVYSVTLKQQVIVPAATMAVYRLSGRQ